MVLARPAVLTAALLHAELVLPLASANSQTELAPSAALLGGWLHPVQMAERTDPARSAGEGA